MNIIRYPERLEWNFLLKRSALQTESLRETVCDILEKVRTQGDRAVIGYEEQFDKVKLNSLEVTEKEFLYENVVPFTFLTLYRRQ